MNYETLWKNLRLILGILKECDVGGVSPDTLIILMDQLEQGLNPIAPTGAQEKH